MRPQIGCAILINNYDEICNAGPLGDLEICSVWCSGRNFDIFVFLFLHTKEKEEVFCYSVAVLDICGSDDYNHFLFQREWT